MSRVSEGRSTVGLMLFVGGPGFLYVPPEGSGTSGVRGEQCVRASRWFRTVSVGFLAWFLGAGPGAWKERGGEKKGEKEREREREREREGEGEGGLEAALMWSGRQHIIKENCFWSAWAGPGSVLTLSATHGVESSLGPV